MSTLIIVIGDCSANSLAINSIQQRNKTQLDQNNTKDIAVVNFPHVAGSGDETEITVLDLSADGGFQKSMAAAPFAKFLSENNCLDKLEKINLIISGKRVSVFAQELANELERVYSKAITVCSSTHLSYEATIPIPPTTPNGMWQVWGVINASEVRGNSVAHIEKGNKTLLKECKNIQAWLDDPQQSFKPRISNSPSYTW